MGSLTRRYRVTSFQLLQFREQLSDQKNIAVHGSAEHGHINIVLPLGLGEVVLSYQHQVEDGVSWLLILLLAHPEHISADTIWQTIEKKIEEAQEDCPQGA